MRARQGKARQVRSGKTGRDDDGDGRLGPEFVWYDNHVLIFPSAPLFRLSGRAGGGGAAGVRDRACTDHSEKSISRQAILRAVKSEAWANPSPLVPHLLGATKQEIVCFV